MDLDAAFTRAARINFLSPEQAGRAELDMPLPIGHGQTNSQPSTVRQMLLWLNARTGHNVLDVGSGSGWATALLSLLVGKNGKVTATEKVPELVEFGRANCQKLKLDNVEFHPAGPSFGYPEHQPYQRILVSASAQEVPPELIEQLAPGGRMVIPVKNSILVIDKDKAGKLHTEENPGFVFVPLLSS